MAKPTLSDMTAFITVANQRSFRRAADRLGLSASSLSHTVRALERNLGVRLLNRTTRSVAPTEAGERLLARLTPVLLDLDEALGVVDDFRETPTGTVRINAAAAGARFLLHTVVPEFYKRYPAIAVDLVTEGRFVDIVAKGFDAGVRLAESVPQDMVAVRFGGDTRFITVASPAYLKTAGKPKTPEDLHRHRCIRIRFPSGKLYRWEFERHGQEVVVDAPGVLTLDDLDLMVEAAAGGQGIAYVPEIVANPFLADKRVVPVLADWCPPIPGLCLYYPDRRQVPGALRVFIETLREVTREQASKKVERSRRDSNPR